MVYDFDTRGCNKGDELLFMPGSFGNQQYPVEFAGKKCDLSKPVVLTVGGVACTYAGPKDVVEGRVEIEYKSYARLYNYARKNEANFFNTGKGEYWRLLAQGTGPDLKVGDNVTVKSKPCNHDIDGVENPAANWTNSEDFKVADDTYYIYQLGVKYGATFEIIGERFHTICQLQMPKPPAKKKQPPKPAK